MKILNDYKDEDLEYVFEQLIATTEHNGTTELCQKIHKNEIFKHQVQILFMGIAIKQGMIVTAENFGCAMHVGMELGYMLAHRELDNKVIEKEMLIPIV